MCIFFFYKGLVGQKNVRNFTFKFYEIKPRASGEVINESYKVLEPRERSKRKKTTQNQYERATRGLKWAKRHICQNYPNDVFQAHRNNTTRRTPFCEGFY
jgi:hypothetical protein